MTEYGGSHVVAVRDININDTFLAVGYLDRDCRLKNTDACMLLFRYDYKVFHC